MQRILDYRPRLEARIQQLERELDQLREHLHLEDRAAEELRREASMPTYWQDRNKGKKRDEQLVASTAQG